MSYLAIASGERIQRNFFQLSHLGNISSSGIFVRCTSIKAEYILCADRKSIPANYFPPPSSQ